MNACKRVLCIFSLVFFAACGILTLVFKDREFSEDENRYLKQCPEISVEGIVEGKYQEELKEYLSDQAAFRDDFMRLYAIAQKGMGKNEYNGVYLCKNDRLIEVYKTPEKTEYINDKLKKAVDNTDAHCMLMLVPTAITIYDEELPWGAGENNAQAQVKDYIYLNSGMDCIDVWTAFEDNKDNVNLYYKTDHHWTTEGAYIAYEEFCKQEGFTPVSKDEFEIVDVSDSFYGTIYSKALTAYQPADTITAYKQDMSGITVTYQSGEGELYAEEYLEKKDKYAYFLNGNQSIITIENTNVDNGKVLLVVKDSYANCFVPFLINHYEKIVVLDTRYYRMGVTTTAEEIGATDILFLFNLNTLDTDTAVAGIY
ncbi:MAG: DHHW family protein [Lachnospiraceae bacterium]